MDAKVARAIAKLERSIRKFGDSTGSKAKKLRALRARPSDSK